MRQAGAIAAEVLLKLVDVIKPGASTEDLDRIAEEFIRYKGAIPTFIGYQGYPKTLCTSINEEVVHGIPSPKQVLKEGDVIGIDVGVTYKGFVGDHAKTFAVGQVSPDKAKLITVTEEALEAGIQALTLGNRVGDISAAVQKVANRHGYGIVKDFVGHGIGRKMHEEPQVPNFGEPGTGPRLKTGMVLAIEPMFNLGTGEVKVLKDGWTVVTQDGKCSAHFEHTIALTPSGSLVLTRG
jgi:methionyl aminopeptidase